VNLLCRFLTVERNQEEKLNVFKDLSLWKIGGVCMENLCYCPNWLISGILGLLCQAPNFVGFGAPSSD
jgi:hypothetical protein